MGYNGVGEQHGLTHHSLHSIWRSMKNRCFNTKSKSYKHYGGRGILICREWDLSFLSFYNFCIDNGWKDGLQVDRIDNNGNYEPNNCQFITQSENKSVGKRRSLVNTSGNIGVYWHSRDLCWYSSIKIHGKCIYLGKSLNKEDAINLRISAEKLYFNERRTGL